MVLKVGGGGYGHRRSVSFDAIVVQNSPKDKAPFTVCHSLPLNLFLAAVAVTVF